MEQMRVARQVIDFQRAALDSMLGNVLTLWDQTERMYSSMMDQTAWLPEEGKKAFMEWVKNNKRGCEEFKNAVNDGYSRLDRCFTGPQSPQQHQG
jgi:hypothetical protein